MKKSTLQARTVFAVECLQKIRQPHEMILRTGRDPVVLVDGRPVFIGLEEDPETSVFVHSWAATGLTESVWLEICRINLELTWAKLSWDAPDGVLVSIDIPFDELNAEILDKALTAIGDCATRYGPVLDATRDTAEDVSARRGPGKAPRRPYDGTAMKFKVIADGSLRIGRQTLAEGGGAGRFEYVLTVLPRHFDTIRRALGAAEGADVVATVMENAAMISRNGEARWLTALGIEFESEGPGGMY